MASRFPGGIGVANRKYYDTLNNVNGTSPSTETVLREMVIPISYLDGTAEVPTNFKFNTPVVVQSCYLRVRTAEATGTTKTIKIGTATADSGNPLVFINGASVASTGLVTASAGQALTITPATTTNPTVSFMNGLWTNTGGTVTHQTVTRGTSTTGDLATSGPLAVYLSTGDSVTLTYSGAPTCLFFPEVDNLAFQPGAVRVSWTPGSTDWANFIGDIVIRYQFIADTTLTPDFFAEIAEQGAGF